MLKPRNIWKSAVPVAAFSGCPWSTLITNSAVGLSSVVGFLKEEHGGNACVRHDVLTCCTFVASKNPRPVPAGCPYSTHQFRS
jgi:hypothetical protein